MRSAKARIAVTAHRPHHQGARPSCISLRGEYLFVAEGAGGMRVYDVANIANKGVSQRIISAPVLAAGP